MPSRHPSPFRYPGGKSWLFPHVRQQLLNREATPSVFIEPFAGGASVGLGVALHGLAERVLLSELDRDVSAVWEVVITGSDAAAAELCQRILAFSVSQETVESVLGSEPISVLDRAFRTIVRNRMARGGILHPSAGLLKAGENGKGLLSRWYPVTLVKRIKVLRDTRDRINFERGDAFDVVRRYANDPTTFIFVDPPYTLGGKRTGSKLYTHAEIDHEQLFSLMTRVKGTFIITYNDAPEVRELADRHGFQVEGVLMKNAHHAMIHELVISPARNRDDR
ncbi:MAG: DNA methyltransferase [Gammaproteobacteria bacterium RIFOXYA12_FULL_61_12]|nr:MAG: DNA methyltransferase [Gammaproteobacteria bacterium RIFOXYA12_FULL_61_12]OGT89443.1 MAG: DNA methyltransferase [Gammaproteobacteria bacterium RIFOXYD12_FULL_61_37]